MVKELHKRPICYGCQNHNAGDVYVHMFDGIYICSFCLRDINAAFDSVVWDQYPTDKILGVEWETRE